MPDGNSHASDRRVWFITGCSTGFGRELAQQVLERGDLAIVTARDTSKLEDLTAGYADESLALALDVTDREQVRSAVRAARERFGHIDVLVNNAGYGYLAAIEEGEDDPVRRLFDTNVFGLIDVTKAVLPGMRARRSGRIVNVSSIGGIESSPATGYYHATKFAVEGLSGSLALELAPLGIKVMVVEPAPFRTDFTGRSIVRSNTRIADYDDTAGKRAEAATASSGKQAGDPKRGAAAIIEAILSAEPPKHLLLGKMALDIARKKLDDLRADYDWWESVSLGADYPESAAVTSG